MAATEHSASDTTQENPGYQAESAKEDRRTTTHYVGTRDHTTTGTNQKATTHRYHDEDDTTIGA